MAFDWLRRLLGRETDEVIHVVDDDIYKNTGFGKRMR